MSQWGSSGSVQAVRWQSKLTHDPGRFAGGLAVPNRADGHRRECQARLEQCQRQRQHRAIGSVGCGEGMTRRRARVRSWFDYLLVAANVVANLRILEYRIAGE
eukprot:COSAG06_NODE_2529_length_6714_cov_2.777627_9_plen_103_part_00